MKKSLPIALVMQGATLAALAVPACPHPVTITDTAGVEHTVTLQGDEHFNWARTVDGKIMMRTDAPDVWSEITPETLASRAAMAKSHKAAPSTQIDGTFPANGNRKLLMLLINYADTQTTYTQSDFNNYMNQHGFGGIGSFRDYYLENSYGALDIETTVTRWVTVPYGKSSYGADGAVRLIMDALNILDSELDLNEFDNDGDGVLDGLAVIHQGSGAEASGSSSDIWSHSGTVYGITYDGVELRRYTIQPELLANTGRQSTIGVMCHEFGHNLGAPDFYDTDYSQSGGEYCGTGLWDLMGSGAWNGDYGNRPAGTNMWQKIQLGWVNPTLLGQTQQISAMPPAHNNAVGYRFDTTVPGDYFILENRQQAGQFDISIPGHGLIIYHVDENIISENINNNVINVTYPQGIYTVCAGATSDPNSLTSSYGWVNTQSAPFPGESNKTSFNDTSLPSTRSTNGRYSYRGLSEISETADGNINFKFEMFETPGMPLDLTANSVRGIVTLDWVAPDADEAPIHYNIYRNDVLTATVDTPGYVDNQIGSLTDITYCVDAEYANGLISPTARTSVTIPESKITSVNADVEGSTVSLSWELDTRITRMPDWNTSQFKRESYNATSLETAHLFRASDLAVYKGYKIRRVAFLPLQSQREITCQVTIYSINPATGERTVASQRNVSEIGTMVWNDMLLTKSVEITGESDILVAVKYIAKDGNNIQLITDAEEALDGYGNLVSVNGSEFIADPKLTGNIFMYATLAAPASQEQRTMVDPGEVCNPRVDMAFPSGFAIYRNGVRVGTSAGNLYCDVAPQGTHQYEITNLYRGANESVATEPIEVYVAETGVNETLGSSYKVYSDTNGVVITGFEGDVSIVTLLGIEIARQHANGNCRILLSPGIYLVRCGNITHKVKI